MRLIAGIDPGNNGAVVFLRRQQREEYTIDRVFRLSKGEEQIADLFRRVYQSQDFMDVAFLEQVHGWGEGRSFNFGKYYGFVRGVLVAFGVNIVDVQPNVWMRDMGLPKQKDLGKAGHREAIREKAALLQADVSTTNWNAAAILIALYGLKKLGGQLYAPAPSGLGLRD